jgi:hypothetical protein
MDWIGRKQLEMLVLSRLSLTLSVAGCFDSDRYSTKRVDGTPLTKEVRNVER